MARPVSNDRVNSIRVLTGAAYGSRNPADPTHSRRSPSGRLLPVTGSSFRASKRRLAAALAVVSMFAAACGGGETEVAEPATGATTAESASGVIPQLDFTAPELAGSGGTIAGGDYEGTDLVVWFWAPW